MSVRDADCCQGGRIDFESLINKVVWSLSDLFAYF